MKKTTEVKFISDPKLLNLEHLCNIINSSDYRVYDLEGAGKLHAEPVFDTNDQLIIIISTVQDENS